MGIITSLLMFSFLPNIMVQHHAAAATSSTGIVVPLYGYPSSDWNNVIQTKEAYPGVPMVAVINPADGPGTWADPNFVSGVSNLESAGITVLGYIWTNYASRSISSAEADILAYHNLYGLAGVYLDQMSNIPGYEWYYSTLTSYAKSIGMWLVFGNPGADVPSSYIGTVDSIIIYENAGAPSLGFLAGWHTSYSKSNFGVVAYNIGSLDPSYVASAAADLGWIYLTNGVWPNPYSPVASYLSSLASDLAGTASSYSVPAAPAAATAPASSGSGGGSIGVITVDDGGNEIWGMYATLWQNGAEVASCFSPCTFSVSGGLTYQVAVANWGSYGFAEWGDGTRSTFYAVSEPSSPTQITLWAVY